jgi:hypothetical protein
MIVDAQVRGVAGGELEAEFFVDGIKNEIGDDGLGCASSGGSEEAGGGLGVEAENFSKTVAEFIFVDFKFFS